MQAAPGPLHHAAERADAEPAPRLSAVLIVLNEERHLAECLASLRGVADEVVVLDSGSTDATVRIAEAAGARVAQRAFDGYGPQKQAALALARGRWILSVDADERVTPALAREIATVVAADGEGAAGFWLRRELIYLGRRLRFGGAERDWVLRLARREAAHFAPLVIHEHLEVAGRTRRLQGALLHLKYRTLGEHVAQMNRYTDIIAARRAAQGRRFTGWQLLRIPWELFRTLIVRLGILDGRAGIIYAVMASYYAFLKSAKLWPEGAHRPPAAERGDAP
ncbi:MAG TPA: glycosyltransferase family 2 protein [Gemmatimonadaceae bacterium]|nr:glycosyltransferase family 2 protein [Gemmatimonadaceae bacterium]